MAASGSTTVTCTVRNTGKRIGDEVVQLYVHDVVASLARPVIELKGFERIQLSPGESRDVSFPVGPDQLKMLDEKLHWIVEPGDFRILIGASSKDIRLRGQITINSVK